MSGKSHNSKVLVVDDDPDIREVLRMILEPRGYQVDEAAHGKEALQRLEDGDAPGLVVLDLMMPVMSGGEFLARIRADPRFVDLPVVVISAWENLAPEVKSALAFLTKPLEAPRLLQIVEQYCGPGNRREE